MRFCKRVQKMMLLCAKKLDCVELMLPHVHLANESASNCCLFCFFTCIWEFIALTRITAFENIHMSLTCTGTFKIFDSYNTFTGIVTLRV